MITVIIPNFNNGQYIQEAIQSVKIQTNQNFKCIIVDDMSTDNSVDIINSLIKNDQRFKLIINDLNHGVAYSRNVAIKEANTDLILPLDSDDMIENTYLERIQNFFDFNSDYTLFYGKWKFIGYNANDNNIKLGNIRYTTYQNFLKSNQIHCSCAFKKNDAIKCGLYDESLPGYEDWEFLIRLLFDNKKVFYDPTDSLYYRRFYESRNSKVDNVNVYNFIIQKNINIYRKYFKI